MGKWRISSRLPFSLRPTSIILLAGFLVLSCDDIASRIEVDKAGPPPQMNIKDGQVSIPSGGTNDFPECAVNDSVEKVYTIENIGDGVLHLTGSTPILVVNEEGTTFTATQPALAINPHTDATFSVAFSPATHGAKGATVVIQSDDPDPGRARYMFTINGVGVKSGLLSVPNGGEAYLPGTTCTIVWGSFQSQNVKIELMKGGSLHTTISPTTPNDGAHAWSIPVGFDEGSDYRIRITTTDSFALHDESDGAFAIGTIAVTSPNGGELYDDGGAYDVTWSSGLGGSVKIELLKDADVHRLVAASAPNTNTYHWDVPGDLGAGSTYRIRVTSLSNPDITAQSANTFTIREWLDYGFASAGQIEDSRIAIGADGKPIVVSSDYVDSHKVKIMKWTTGTTWSSLGTIGTLTGNRCDIAIDASDGKPVVIFRDFGDSKSRFHIMKWSSGTTWIDRGFVGAGAGDFGAIAMSASNRPWVIYQDCDPGNDGAAFVKEWSETTNWWDRGKASTGLTYFNDIAMNPVDDKPCITFRDASPFQPRVKRWVSGTTWSDLAFSALGGGNYNAVAVGSDGMPVVAYQELGGSPPNRCRVQKYNGSGWTDLGYLNDGQADFMGVAIDPADGLPIVVFSDMNVSNRAHIKKYVSGSTWIDLGFASAGSAWYTSIAIDPSDGNPVVVFRDDSQSLRAHVVKRFF